MSSPTGPGHLSRRTLASYAGIWLPLSALTMPIAVYLPPFYSETLGLDLTTIGLLFTLARVWDTVTDPVMGVIIDRVDTPWGRRKPWIAIATPILMLAAWMVYLPPSDGVDAFYLGFWLFVLYVGYTMVGIASQSWGAELAPTYDERSRLFGWREVFVLIGMTTVLALPALVDLVGSGRLDTKVASMGWYVVILLPVAAVPLLLWVPDHSAQRARVSINFREAAAILLGNRLLRRILIADLLTGFALAASGALYIFMATYIFELAHHASFALLLFFLTATLAMPIWVKLAYAVGKSRAIQVSIVYGVAVNTALFVLAEPGNVVVLWGYTLLFGVAFGAAPTLLRSMLADVTDLDELESGAKRTAMYYALMLTTSKLASAIAVGVTLPLVDLGFGFAPGEDNSPEALHGLLFTYAMVPAIALLLAYLPMRNYPLEKSDLEDIQRQLGERDRATSQVSPGP